MYREGLGDDLANLTLDDLNEHSVTAHTDDEERQTKRWSVYCALVGSLALNGGRYALKRRKLVPY